MLLSYDKPAVACCAVAGTSFLFTDRHTHKLFVEPTPLHTKPTPLHTMLSLPLTPVQDATAADANAATAAAAAAAGCRRCC